MTAPDALDEWFRAELAATMRPCPEVPREVRAGWAALAAEQARQLEEMCTGTTPELPFREAV